MKINSMKPSEMFEGPNSSLRKTFDNTMNNQECRCELDGFQGAIWKGDCPIHGDKPLKKQDIIKRFDSKVWKKFSDNSFNFNGSWRLSNKKLLLDFIQSEINEALREQQDEIIRRIDGEYIESCRYWNGIDECKNCGLSREGLEALFKDGETG